ncbi:MAG: sigma-70 family RNA polymerase sigma factor [Myxococcales bacterium]|nr:sigma-70 family RNA polymerase sigma factor [Myxococcales bacterium]
MKQQIWFAWTGQALPPIEQFKKDLQDLFDACQRPTSSAPRFLRGHVQEQMEAATTTAARQLLLIQEAMRAAAGLRLRWEELYRAHKHRWYGYLHHGYSLSPDVESEIFSGLTLRVLPWKIIQEQLLDIVIQWDSFLKTCVKREVMAWCKQYAREIPQESERLGELPSQVAPEKTEALLEWKEQVQALLDFVEAKAESAPGEATRNKWLRRRQVLMWLLLEEWNQSEIAHTLGVGRTIISEDVGILRSYLLQHQQQKRGTSRYEA